MAFIINRGKKSKYLLYIPSGGTVKPTPVPTFTNEKSLLFDGVDDYLDAGAYTGIDTTDTFSISLWIKMPSGGGGYVVGKNHSSSYWSSWFKYTITESTIEVYTYALAFKNTTLSLTTDTWTHFVMAIDRGLPTQLDRCKIYKNGVAITNITNANFGQVLLDASPLILGARQVGTASPVINTPFEGNIDEISIWSNTLTSAEAVALYNLGTPTDLDGETGLINWWRNGDDATFPTIPNTDNPGTNDATMTNMTSGDIVADVP